MKEEIYLYDEKKNKPFGKIIASILILLVLAYSIFLIDDKSFQFRSVGIVLALVIGNLILIWIPNILSSSVQTWLSRIFFFLTPFFSFFIVERFNYINIWNIENKRFILNIVIISFLLCAIYLISNRTQIASVITTILLYLVGLSNFYVFAFRGTPILAADIASMGTAANVAANYSYEPNSRIIINGLLVFAFLVLVCRMKMKKGFKWKNRIAVLISFCVLLGVFLYGFYETDIIDNANIRVSVWYPQKSYRTNGFVLSFMVTSKYIKIDKPEGYSLKAVDEITSKYISDSKPANDKKVNVIAIMDEAFTDLTLDGELELSEDYMPFIRSLDKDTVKGTLYMSVFGGNTANSEFEFLTGNTLGFLPTRSVPYQLYIKNPLASLTYTLKAQGYVGNKAIHPYKGDGWARPTTYPLLGFEEFITIDNFNNPEVIRKYVSDEESFSKIIEQYEETRRQSDDPFYVFNVTMQNHGGYDKDYDNLERKIKVLGDNADDQAERYVNLAKKTDEAFERLVYYFSNVDEPTVIVFFGDHQPSIHTAFYNKLMGKDESALSQEETMTKYQVPFVIWANYDIEEKKYDKLSANYLSSILLDTIGAQKTGYQKFLLDFQKDVPVITANGYFGSDGKLYQIEDKSKYSKRLKEYEILQYNNMFDIDNRKNEFFFLESIQE